MGKTYKAAIYYEGGDHGIVKIEERQLPDQVGDNDVVVKNLIATICGADARCYRDGGGQAHMIWDGYEFGHEMVSEVVEVGKNVTDVKVGDWIFPNMGHAYHDHHRMATCGGFSEYLYLPDFTFEGDWTNSQAQPSAVMLDKSLGLENLCLLEPMTIGTRSALDMKGRGTTAVVIGCGMIGLGCGIALKHIVGFEKVMMLDFSDYRLEIAKGYDLLTCNPSKEDLDAVLYETFGETFGYGGKKCKADCWVDCIGIQPATDYFFKYARPMATLGITGVFHEPCKIDAVSVCYNQQWIKGCGATPLKYCFEMIMDMERNGIDLAPLITHKIKLDDIEEGLKMFADPQGVMKVAIDYVNN